MRVAAQLKALIFLTVCWTAVPQVVAADEFGNACKYYEQKNYLKALPGLEATTIKYPTYWPGHYYLAHTYLALGQRIKARNEYQSSLNSKPAPLPEIVAVCQKMITSLGGTPEMPMTEPLDTIAADAAREADKSGDKVIGEKVEKAASGPSPQEMDSRWRKKAIQDVCDQQISALRQELKERIAQAELNTNNWEKPSPWECPQTHLPDEERAAITREYDEKIQALQSRARAQIEAIK